MGSQTDKPQRSEMTFVMSAQTALAEPVSNSSLCQRLCTKSKNCGSVFWNSEYLAGLLRLPHLISFTKVRFRNSDLPQIKIRASLQGPDPLRNQFSAEPLAPATTSTAATTTGRAIRVRLVKSDPFRATFIIVGEEVRSADRFHLFTCAWFG